MRETEFHPTHHDNPTNLDSFDGKSKWGTYEPLAHKGDLPSVEIEGSKPYNGSCHCGKVTVAVTCKPLDETYDETLVECNCSICERVRLYPTAPGPPNHVYILSHT